MAKPIFIFKLPYSMSVEQSSKIAEGLTTKLDDYHVLCFRESGLSEVKYEVLNAIDVDDEQLSLIINDIKKEINYDKL